MSSVLLTQRIQRIVGLKDEERSAIESLGISNESDLRYLKFVDYPEEVPLLKKRKLEVIGAYLGKGLSLTDTMSIEEVQLALQNANATLASATSTSASNALDPTRGAPKVYTDMLPEFSGNAVDYEDWERK